MSEILVAGIEGDIPSFELLTTLQKFDLILGTARFLTQLNTLKAELIPIVPLAAAFKHIEQGLVKGRSVAILASGDPLFYGIGRKLLTQFSKQKIKFLPSPTSIQQACARFGLPWDDAQLISLHGRQHNHLP